jgi:hypothetical protein
MPEAAGATGGFIYLLYFYPIDLCYLLDDHLRNPVCGLNNLRFI